jgi:VWFA-related protein
MAGLGIVAALAGGLRAQDDGQPRQTFHSSADLVTIQASVRDGRGRALSGLTAADFEVWDNGQLRPILSLRADQQSPVSVAILVDMSGSMANPTKMGMARQTFDSLLTELRSGDEAALFTFDARLHERHPFTADI